MAVSPFLLLLLPLAVAGGFWLLKSPRHVLLTYGFMLPLEFYVSTQMRLTINQVLQGLLLLSWGGVTLVHARQLRWWGGWPMLRWLTLGLAAFFLLSLGWAVNLDAASRQVLRYLLAIGVFGVITVLVRRREQLEQLVTAICLGTCVMAIYGWVQYVRRDYDFLYPYFSPFYNSDLWLSRGTGFSVVATFSNPNGLAYYATMVLPLFMGQLTLARAWRKWFWLAALISLTAITFLTYSKTAWFVVAALYAAWFFLRFRLRGKFLFLWLAFWGFFLLALFSDVLWRGVNLVSQNAMESSVSPRLTLWGMALQVLVYSPLWGYGVDGFAPATESLRLTAGLDHLVRPHNVYLQMLVDGGLIGFALFFGAVAAVFLRGWRSYRHAVALRQKVWLVSCLLGIVSFLLYGLTETPHAANASVNTQWVLMGLLATACLIREIRRPELPPPAPTLTEIER